MIRRVVLVALGVCGLAAGVAQAQDPLASPVQGVETPAAAPQAPTGQGFRALFERYRAARQAGDEAAATQILAQLRRVRVERNVQSLEDVALAFVALGLDDLREGRHDAAEAAFQEALALDPHLPEAHLGLGRIQGPLQAARASIEGFFARLATSRGRQDYLYLLIAAGVMTVFAVAAIFGVIMLVRVGPLLLHDFEEAFGTRRPRSWAIGAYALVLLLPLVVLQGYAWLPLWWLAVLFVYMNQHEKALTAVIALGVAAVGPALALANPLLIAGRNPLLRASLQAMETGPDALAASRLESARAEHPDDRDLVYLLAREQRKAGQNAEASALYRELLESTPGDVVALNNLGNLEFARGAFSSAYGLYKQAAESGPALFRASALYNASLAQLQEFKFEPAANTRAEADGFASGLPARYEALWTFQKEGSAVPAVVDLGPSRDEIWAKFAGAETGIARENVTGTGVSPVSGAGLAAGLLTRFLALAVALIVVPLALGRWRGNRLFTLRCLKCGTPFCKLCHLGTATNELCTQCHHLFVVRDGVSAPARNRKMAEVHAEESRRRKLFRIFSVLSPGAGHLHARSTWFGAGLALVWYGVLGSLAASRLIPVAPAPPALASVWGLALVGVLLVAVFIVANVTVPNFEVKIAVARRGGSRGARAMRG